MGYAFTVLLTFWVFATCGVAFVSADWWRDGAKGASIVGWAMTAFSTGTLIYVGFVM